MKYPDIHALAWDVCSRWLKEGEDASTSFVARKVPGDGTMGDIASALTAMAASGSCAFVRRGVSENRVMFGQTKTVRPWIWTKPTTPRPVIERCVTCGQIINK